MDGGLRCRRFTPGGELAQRQQRIAEPEAGDLVQTFGQPLELARRLQGAQRLELFLRRAARPDQVCVIGVGEPVRLGARGRDHGALLEGEHGVARTGRVEHRLDRVQPLGVRDGVPPPVAHAETGAVGGSDATEEVRALE